MKRQKYRFENLKTIDCESQLLILIIAYSLEFDLQELPKKLTDNIAEIEATFTLFESLGLVEKAPTILGWKPTYAFLEHITWIGLEALHFRECTANRQSAKDALIMKVMAKTAWPDINKGMAQEHRDFAYHVLYCLGLLDDTNEGGWKPTSTLCRLLHGPQ